MKTECKKTYASRKTIVALVFYKVSEFSEGRR